MQGKLMQNVSSIECENTLRHEPVGDRSAAKHSAARKRAATVAHLTSVHYPFDVRIFHKECKTLVAAGYKVILIAAHNNPESVEGVCVEPVCKHEGRVWRMTATVWDVLRKAIASKADLYHFHDPELLPVGVLLKIAGNRVIYDVHEHVTQDILIKEWIRNTYLRKIVSLCAGICEHVCVLAFDAVVAATPAIAAEFSQTKTTLVQNFPAAELDHSVRNAYCKRSAVVIYVGSITEQRGLREMVKAIGKVPGRLQARLSLVGSIGSVSVQQELQSSEHRATVDYLGFKDRSAVWALLGQARAGLAVLHPTRSYIESQATKMFEYMLAGLPIVASNFPLWKDLIDDIGCGITVDPLNVDAIAEAITWILDHPAEAAAMGERGRRAVLEKYNWDTEAQRLLALYQKLLPA
jgi:glycosyltransferase involved in cell wall biosynthesis